MARYGACTLWCCAHAGSAARGRAELAPACSRDALSVVAAMEAQRARLQGGMAGAQGTWWWLAPCTGQKAALGCTHGYSLAGMGWWHPRGSAVLEHRQTQGGRGDCWAHPWCPCWRAGWCSWQQGTRTSLSQLKSLPFSGSMDMLGCHTPVRAAALVGHPAPTYPGGAPPPPRTHSHMHGHSPGSFTPKLYSCGTFTARIGITRQ